MAIRKSEALWEGNLADGKGTMKFGSEEQKWPFTYASRFEEGEGSNPEELIGAAHAGCFSMFLSSLLSKDGHVPDRIHTEATVHLGSVDGAPTIHTIQLATEVDVSSISEEELQEYAQQAKEKCPVSKALAAVNTIELSATLKS